MTAAELIVPADRVHTMAAGSPEVTAIGSEPDDPNPRVESR
jgi:hypothetical protein